MTPEEELKKIREKLGYYIVEASPKKWLDTGSTRLNAVLGSREKGIPYGKILELFGPESNGKTALALFIAGRAQKDGATVAWLDLENSFDERWVQSQGLDPAKVAVFQPKLIASAKGRIPRLQTAEELCSEVEEWWKLRAKTEVDGKIFTVVDSVTAFLVSEEFEAGTEDQNMKTRLGLASFLSQLLRRWVPLALNYGTTILFINQTRMSPGRYGDPEVTPGGKALKFYASVRVKVRRVKGGKIIQLGKMVGLRGIVRNIKNKAGEGSLEGEECGFKCLFGKHDWKFVDPTIFKKEEE